MRALARALDWSATPVGPVEGWPQSLRTALSIVFESKFPMLVCWGRDFVQFYNDPFRPILGVSKHPALGKSTRDTFAEAWHIIGPLFEEVARGGAVGFEDMLVPLDRNGFLEECYFVYSYSPIRDESGGVGGVLVTCTETTARVVAERRLTTLRDLAAQAAHAQDEVTAWRGAAEALSANAADLPFALMYALDANGQEARLIGEGPAGLAPSLLRAPQDDTAWPVFSVAASGTPQLVADVPGSFGTHAGSIWPEPVTSAMVLPITRPGLPQPHGLLVAGMSPRLPFDDRYRDFLLLVADQIATAVANARTYEEERRRTEALVELDRQKTAFFSNVSHEFRTPLTLLLAPLEQAMRRVPRGLGDGEVELLHRNATRLLRLVNALLDFSRIEAARAHASLEPADLSALTRDLASTFESLMQQAELRFEVDCPPLTRPVAVDIAMWEKIVLNLLSNAFKFTLRGSIRVELKELPDRVELRVHDTGAGIPAGDVPRVFERFHRVPGTPSRTFEGSGIGLALVRELARLHDGDVEVVSVHGEGSTFTVSIPIRAVADVDAARPRQGGSFNAAMPFVEEARRWIAGPPALRTQPAPSQVGDSDERIVVADDNADMRDYLGRLLRENYRVELVGDGVAALERIRADPPNLVLADVMMPALDGFGLLTAVRGDERLRSLPVILLSARAGEESRIEGLEAGADEYLVKPFSAHELLASVASQLRLARVRREAEAERTRLLEENAAVMQTLNDVGAMVASDLDRDKVVQEVTDAATVLTTAQFGAFFYNLVNDAGESYMLYTISGVPREAFAKFPMPRNTQVFEPTFKGLGIVRSPDITQDPRYGRNAPYYGMPPGHLPVRSYLGVPVRGRAGDVIGGLFFGHPEVGRFSEHHERLAVGIAAWAAVALENASLYASVQEASRLKDVFLASLSHELRTPLNAILGYSRMLRAGVVSGPKQQKAIETIERNATSLTTIVDDVLDISRIVSGKIRLQVRPVSPAEVLRSALDVVMPAAESKGVRLQSEIDPEVALLAADPDRLQQILWNLLSNAVKFTERGGRVDVRLERVDSWIQVAVIDSGIGIAPEFLPYVFERFRQADTATTRERGGLGLGLAIARQLAEMHGGTIEAFSDGVGCGSTFRLRIPVFTPDREQEQSSPRGPQPAASGGPTS